MMKINITRNFIRYSSLTVAGFSFLLLLIFCCFRASAADVSSGNLITIVFRFDDYTSNNLMGHRLLDTFRKYNIPCTFGVIPYESDISAPQDVHSSITLQDAEILKNAIDSGILEVAQHGYTHTQFQGQYSEFVGRDQRNQAQLIAKGKDLLEGMLHSHISTFIPPWNSYDLNTLQALERIGFTTISSDMSGTGARSSRLSYLPYTCHLRDLRHAIEGARRFSESDSIIVVMFHGFDFIDGSGKERLGAYKDFLGILDWVREQKDVRVRTMAQTVGVMRDLGVTRLLDNGEFLSLNKRLPAHLRDKPSGVYLSSRLARDLGIGLWGRIVFLYAVLLGLLAFSAFWVFVFLSNRRLK